MFINGLNLHEIKSEIFFDYKGDFDLNASMAIGPVEQKTNLAYKSLDDFDSYINAIDISYDSEDNILTGYLYKTNTTKFKVVKRSPFGKSANYMKEIVEYNERSCDIPISEMCFIICISYYNITIHTEKLRHFIRKEKY